MKDDDKPIVQVYDKDAPRAAKDAPAKANDVQLAMQNFDSKQIAEPPKKKYGWVGMVVLLLIIALGIFFMVQLATKVGDAEIKSLPDVIKHANVNYAVWALIVLVSIMFLECFKFVVITHAITGKIKPLNSIKVAFLGRYYDGITPFSAGGQPMQIVYLHKKGYSGGTSTAIVLIKYFINMLSWVTICLLLMSINRGALTKYVDDMGQRRFLEIFGWLGWSINAILPFSIIFFAIFPKITDKILQFFINIATNVSWNVASRKERKTGKSQLRRKIKILRRKEKWINSAHTSVKDFRSSFVVMSHKPVQFILLVLSCAGEQFLNWAFPYFILVALGGDSVAIGAETMFAIMTLSAYASMSVAIVPTPGNSGVLENVILLAFRMLATTVVFWVVFTWRFLTYYIYILIGIGITVFEVIRKLVRSRREKLQNRQNDTVE